MTKIKIALVGAGGYGDVYMNMLRKDINNDEYILTAVIDPFIEKVPSFKYISENNIPMYRALEEFYANDSAELVIISSPLTEHKRQVITALRNGSHVLCEKPLVATVEETEEIRREQKESGKLLGVGFQWSFSESMLSLKRDIINGVFGNPISLRTFISWKRYDDYYESSSWKGRIKDDNGNIILDSIVTNATSHYLHNIFFLMGEEIQSAKLPLDFRAAVYRAKNIESFDTCFLKGNFDNGASFMYAASHSGDIEDEPKCIYEFENAVVTYDGNEHSKGVRALFKDGSEKCYGCPEHSEKLKLMLSAIRGEAEIPCTIDTIIPHLAVCNSIFRKINITDFPDTLLYHESNPAGVFVKGLHAQLLRCYMENKLPSELAYVWAADETRVVL